MVSETSYVVGAKVVDRIREMLALLKASAAGNPADIVISEDVPGDHEEIRRNTPRVSNAQAQTLEWALGLITGA